MRATLFNGHFDIVLFDANEKYQQKKKEYGESWKDMSREQLLRRLLTEIEELKEANETEAIYKETIDVINVALMLAHKVRK